MALRWHPARSGVGQNWRGRLLLSAIAFSILLGVSTVAQPDTASKVRVNIQVIEVSKTLKQFDPSLTKNKDVMKALKEPGFTGAKVVDSLDRDVGKDSGAVKLQLLKGKKFLSVRVLEVNPTKEIVRLKIEIPGTTFSAKTKHVKGASFLVILPPDKNRRLALAITPKISK